MKRVYVEIFDPYYDFWIEADSDAIEIIEFGTADEGKRKGIKVGNVELRFFHVSDIRMTEDPYPKGIT